MAETLSLKKTEAARPPVQWEYNVRFPKAGEPSINELKPLGEQGWELCAVINGAEFIYKRRKQS